MIIAQILAHIPQHWIIFLFLRLRVRISKLSCWSIISMLQTVMKTATYDCKYLNIKWVYFIWSYQNGCACLKLHRLNYLSPCLVAICCRFSSNFSWVLNILATLYVHIRKMNFGSENPQYQPLSTVPPFIYQIWGIIFKMYFNSVNVQRFSILKSDYTKPSKIISGC